MVIDLSQLVTNLCEEILIDKEVDIPYNFFENSEVRDLKEVTFKGSITKLCDDSYAISGVLRGIMILGDAITLEDVSYQFSTNIEEEFDEFGTKNENNLKIVKNTIDITEFLWQNILVEIPLKVVSEKNRDLKLEGDGWRLITEDDLKTRNNSPFSELKEKLDSRKE